MTHRTLTTTARSRGSHRTSPRFSLRRARWLAGNAAVLLWSFLAMPLTGSAQPVDYQVAWIVIGDAAAADEQGQVRAGTQLFRASDLLKLSLNDVKVARVSVEPVVTQLTVGAQICISSLAIRAFAPDQQPIAGAPLSISVRQDQRDRLRKTRSKGDICLRPEQAGEYPVRLTSLLPAPDGSVRGAQIFLRAADEPGRRAGGEGTGRD
jgi:hypothetical protein